MKKKLLCCVLFLSSPAQGYRKNSTDANHDDDKRALLQRDVDCKEFERIKDEAGQRYEEAHEELHLAEVEKNLSRDIFLVAFTKDRNILVTLGRRGKRGRINPEFTFRRDLMYVSLFEDITLARQRILEESIEVPSLTLAEDNYAKIVLRHAEAVRKFEEVQSSFFEASENYKKYCLPLKNNSSSY